MIRRSPCEVYIKYLLVHPEGYSDEQVIDLLRLKQLDFLGPTYLQRLRSDLRLPNPFRPHDLQHRPSSRFVMDHKLYYLFHPDAAMEGAYALLDDPPMKELLESMLITDDPEPAIYYRLQRMGRQCHKSAIERYRFFFFNPELVDSTEMRALLRYRTDFVDPNADDYEDQMRRAMQKSAYRDARTMVSSQPTKTIAGVLNQMRMGFIPSQLQLHQLIEATRIAALAQAQSATLIGGRNGSSETRDFILAAKMLTEMMQEVGSSDQDLTRELQKLALETDGTPVPNVFELTGGDHTVELMPTLAPQEEPDDGTRV